VANNFGQGITGKAVSERMLRMKREESWNLSINRDAAAGTPRKKPTPKAKIIKDEENNDDEEDWTTPSKKKTPLNKVQNGRVAKKKTGANASFTGDLVKDEYETNMSPENPSVYNSGSFNMEAFGQEQGDSAAFYDGGDDDQD
jgi:hypothetical protein